MDRSCLMRFRFTPKDDSFYDLFADLAGHLVSGARKLAAILEARDVADREATADERKALEHDADESTHAILRKVNSSFITPFDREDIYKLASSLDDCMDHMEAGVSLTVLYHIE